MLGCEKEKMSGVEKIQPTQFRETTYLIALSSLFDV